MFTILAIAFFLAVIGLLVWSVLTLEDSKIGAGVIATLAIVAFCGGCWFQTNRVVSTQYVGISQNTFTQELAGPYKSGISPKPFFGTMYEYPASTNTERCEQFTPAIKGSYGVTLDLCFYYNTSAVDWLSEIHKTGQLDAGSIMAIWRNNIVGDVAKSVKDYTPEALSDDRAAIESNIFKNVSPWFGERGIQLVSLSFKNWDFTSPEVAKSFDASIVSQRKITEQTALLEAAKISRQREQYEAETAKIVADQQRQSLDLLGLTGESAVQYLWIKLFTEKNTTPDVVILGAGNNVPVSIPFVTTKPITQ